MQMFPNTFQKPHYFILYALLAIVGISFFAVAPAHAADDKSVNSRLQYGDIEKYCGDNTTLGMVWLSNDGDNYYSETVNIDANTKSASVQVRGAANACNYNWQNPAKIYAANVSTDNSRLSISGNEFYRGDLPAGTKNWTSIGSSLSATLNVDGIATCNGTGRVEGSLVVNIKRTLKYTQGSDSVLLGPGSEDVTVRISRDCPRSQWTLNGQSYIKNTQTDKSPDGRLPTGLSQNVVKARVGDRLNWYHDLRNNGPDAMLTNISYSISRNGFSAADWQGRTPAANAKGGVNELFVRHYARYADTNIDPNRSDAYTLYDVRDADMGSTLCENIVWVPKSWNDNSEGGSNQACAVVPYEYALVPTVSGIKDGNTTESDRQNVTVQGMITNGPNGAGEGPTRSFNDIRWQLTEVVFDAGKPIPQKGDGYSAATTDPCTYVTGERAGSCKVLASETRKEGFSNSRAPVTVATQKGNQGTYEVGTRICYFMSVDKRQAGYDMPSKYQWLDTEWRHSAMSCLVVAKKPKVQVLGGDVLVGRRIAGMPSASSPSNISTSSSFTNADKLFGSWGEYGIAATGTISGMASGSGTATGYVAPVAFNLCDVSLLTFTNQRPASGSLGAMCQPTKIGQYSFESPMPNVASRFNATGAPALSGTVNIASVINGSTANSRIYTSNASSLTLRGGSSINAGRWMVINAPNTDITIDGDINYTNGTLRSMSDIPQVVIIARNITINENVTNVDAWLVANGTAASGGTLANGRILTCNIASKDVNSTNCNKRLTVNGPVLANRLVMLRTAGAGPGNQAGQPAEVFNLRPDAYLWVANQSANSGRVTTVETTELPPRF